MRRHKLGEFFPTAGPEMRFVGTWLSRSEYCPSHRSSSADLQKEEANLLEEYPQGAESLLPALGFIRSVARGEGMR